MYVVMEIECQYDKTIILKKKLQFGNKYSLNLFCSGNIRTILQQYITTDGYCQYPD